jgi:hypothetical protein
MTWEAETELASRARYMRKALEHLRKAQEARRRGDMAETKRFLDYATCALESGKADVRIIHEVASEPLPPLAELFPERKERAA